MTSIKAPNEGSEGCSKAGRKETSFPIGTKQMLVMSQGRQ